MTDIQKVLQTKQKIIDHIRLKGPELPVRVAAAVGMSNLFTAAFMSELISEQKLKISNMRVGSSPLYYIEGQESQLQNYTEYLNHKEKEAFRKLKESQILQDEELEPAIRIALRSIKDFAVPLQIMHNNEQKIFWKIHTLNTNEAKEMIDQKLNPKKEITRTNVQEKITENKEDLETQKVESSKKEITLFESKEKKRPQKTQEKEVNYPFINAIKEILVEKNFEILSEILVKKKEFIAKVRTDTPIGKQEIYLVAKDKKKINIEDLVSLSQKSQSEKMPTLILSNGEIDKKAQDYYKEWRNLIKHEKIKF